MKRKTFLILFIFGLAVIVSAQGWGGRQPLVSETVTVTGTMVVSNGIPALKSGEVTYYIGGINRLIGFVDGLKEGAQVTVEGSSIATPSNNNFKFLTPSKLTFNGKTYEFNFPRQSFGPGGMMMSPYRDLPRMMPPPQNYGRGRMQIPPRVRNPQFQTPRRRNP